MLTWRVPLHSFRKEYNLLELTTTHWELSGARLNQLELNRPHRNSVEFTRTHWELIRTHWDLAWTHQNSLEVRTHWELMGTQWDLTWTHQKLIKQESIENSFKLISISLELSRNQQEIIENSHRTQNHTRYKIRPPAAKDKRYRGWRGDFHSEPTSQGQHARTHKRNETISRLGGPSSLPQPPILFIFVICFWSC